jgi:hypothetical protein
VVHWCESGAPKCGTSGHNGQFYLSEDSLNQSPARVMVEYLLDVKGLTFDQLMSEDIVDINTLNELVATENVQATARSARQAQSAE